MTPDKFVADLAAFRMPSVFNPWTDCCPIHDVSEAPIVRRENLQRFLEAAIEAGSRTMWIARDLGYRGGRRTGVPLTDELHLTAASKLMGGIDLKRSTVGSPVAERTAAVIWRVLAEVSEPVVLWNVFPFHPHGADDPMSNRCHTRREREETWPLLKSLIDLIKPDRIIAIGRDAGSALDEFGVEMISIRHPSYGGQTEFISGMRDLYGVRTPDSNRTQLDLGFRDYSLGRDVQFVAAG